MAEQKGNGLDLRTASGQEINEAINRGVFAALRRHKEAGVPIVVWENGQIVHIPADEIQVPDESGDASPTDVTSSAGD